MYSGDVVHIWEICNFNTLSFTYPPGGHCPIRGAKGGGRITPAAHIQEPVCCCLFVCFKDSKSTNMQNCMGVSVHCVWSPHPSANCLEWGFSFYVLWDILPADLLMNKLDTGPLALQIFPDRLAYTNRPWRTSAGQLWISVWADSSSRLRLCWGKWSLSQWCCHGAYDLSDASSWWKTASTAPCLSRSQFPAQLVSEHQRCGHPKSGGLF